MLDTRASKTTAAKAALALAGFTIARRYPRSRIIVAFPLIQAGLSLLKAKQRYRQVRGRRGRISGLLERLG